MLKKILFQEFDKFRAAIYPDRCWFCNTVIRYKTDICPECQKSVKRISGEKCISCGMSKDDCYCKGRSHFYNGITAPYMYDERVRSGILRWKYHGNIHAIKFFAKETSNSIISDFSSIKFDAITYIPQTTAEQEEREFNQSQVLAQEIGEYLKIPTKTLLKKVFETARQHDLPLYRRSGNVFGVFDCINKSEVTGKTILLIDDIKTSGQTIDECAKVLHLNDAAQVYCAVIAIAKNRKATKNLSDKNIKK